MSGSYRIVEAQLPLVLGIAGHDLIAVLNPANQVIMEFDGLATSSSGVIKPIGYLPSDTLKVYEFTGQTYYSSTESQAQIASSTTLAGIQPYINAMVTCKNDMNAESLSYPFLGLGANSNSVASTLDACMGVTEPSLPNSALITPGVGTLLLPTATITSVQQANGRTQLSLTGDNAVSSDTTGAATSTVNVSNSNGTTETATITTSGGAGDATLTNKNSAGTVVGTEADVIQSTGAQSVTITGIAQADADGAAITTAAGATDTVSGTNNTIHEPGSTTTSVATVILDGNNNHLSSVRTLVGMLPVNN